MPHMLYAGIPLKVLQSLMGHVNQLRKSTKVFALDVAARHVQFSMPNRMPSPCSDNSHRGHS
jgi:site-specific recombinase XerD